MDDLRNQIEQAINENAKIRCHESYEATEAVMKILRGQESHELERLGDIVQKQGELILMQEQELLSLRGPLAPRPSTADLTGQGEASAPLD